MNKTENPISMSSTSDKWKKKIRKMKGVEYKPTFYVTDPRTVEGYSNIGMFIQFIEIDEGIESGLGPGVYIYTNIPEDQQIELGPAAVLQAGKDLTADETASVNLLGMPEVNVMKSIKYRLAGTVKPDNTCIIRIDPALPSDFDLAREGVNQGTVKQTTYLSR